MASVAGRNGAAGDSTLPGSPASIVCGGAVRSTPSTTGAGRGAEVRSTVVVAPVSSVVVRLLPPPLPPGRNSATRPSTLTASPTAVVGAEPVNTNRPSLVAGSSSGVTSCIQYPERLVAVTTPCTPCTVRPAYGERWPAPCTSWMVWVSTGPGGGGVAVQVCAPAVVPRG